MSRDGKQQALPEEIRRAANKLRERRPSDGFQARLDRALREAAPLFQDRDGTNHARISRAEMRPDRVKTVPMPVPLCPRISGSPDRSTCVAELDSASNPFSDKDGYYRCTQDGLPLSCQPLDSAESKLEACESACWFDFSERG